MGRSRSALLIIDMINALDFPEGPQLLRQALPVARRIARLKQRLKDEGAAAIYVNDNFTHWQYEFREVVAICSQEGVTGAPLARLLAPDTDDYTILKPQHSAFHDTPLQALLRHLDIHRVILTGISGDHCVLASAMDGHMRGLEVAVAQDCVASITRVRNRNALALLRTLPIEVATAARLSDRAD